MRKVEKLAVSYCGYKDPDTEEELEMEILGLQNAIKNAELRISMLKQGLQLNRMIKTASEGVKLNEKTINSPEAQNK
jgi:hypothetical protein